MTHTGTSQNGRTSPGRAKNVSKTVQSVEEIPETLTPSPCRRSMRLKAINDISKSEDSSLYLQQQATAVCKPFVDNCIKVEIQLGEDCVNDANDGGYNQNCNKQGSDTSCDVESITLRDLKTRCKAKKCKLQHSVASKQIHALLKPKEEEADLEEPLIVFKLKNSKKSAAERKRRKHELSRSDSSDAIEGATAQTCSFTSISAEHVTATTMESSPNGLSTEDNTCSSEKVDFVNESVDLKVSTKLEPSGGAAENFGTVTQIDNVCTVSSTASKKHPVHSGSPQSTLSLKNEMMKFGIWDEQVATNDPVSTTSDFIVKGDLDDSAEFLQGGTGASDIEESTYFITQPLLDYSNDLIEIASHKFSPLSTFEHVGSLSADSSQLVYDVSKDLESNPTHDENTVYVAIFSNADFISRINSPVLFPTKVERDDGSELEKGDLSCSSTTGLHCVVNRASTEYVEPEGVICSSENEEHFGSASAVGCSEPLSSSTLLVSTPGIRDVGSSDICKGTENGSISLEETVRTNITNNRNYPASRNSSKSISEDKGTDISNSNMVSKDFGNLFHEALEQEMPETRHESDPTIDHNIESAKISHDSGELYVRGMLVGENENQKAPCIEEHAKLGANDICSPQHTHPPLVSCNDSSAVDEMLPDNVKSFYTSMEQILNDYTEIGNSTDMEGHTEVVESNTRDTFSQFSTHVDGLQSPCDDSSITTEKISPSKAEEKLHASADKATCSTLLTHPTGGQKVEELKFDNGIKNDHPPKKLFSNRQSISPTSQEKLCQALNGMDLYDAMLSSNNRKRLPFEKRTERECSSSTSGCGEGDMMAGSGRMTKRLKSRRNDSPLVSKGILKSLDNSSGKHCSCMKMSLMLKQTQEAITFSQRQVRDFESVAMKLLKGLKSMKDIVEGTLSSDSGLLSAPSKFTADEIREAANNASELEATTHRWLSIFTRDCSRFYKIMRARENQVASIDNAVQKERRRITFADEVGGSLCHIKVFEPVSASVVADNSENNDR